MAKIKLTHPVTPDKARRAQQARANSLTAAQAQAVNAVVLKISTMLLTTDTRELEKDVVTAYVTAAAAEAKCGTVDHLRIWLRVRSQFMAAGWDVEALAYSWQWSEADNDD